MPRRPASHPLRPIMRVLQDLRVSAMLLVFTLLPTAAPASARAPVKAPDDAAERERLADGYVIHVPGVAGPRYIDRWLAEGIVAGGGGSEAEIFDWVGERRGLKALVGEKENRRQARLLARRILELKRAAPGRPMIIVAHSGGTAIAAWALEVLPEVAGELEAKEQRGEEASNVGGRGNDVDNSRGIETTRRSSAESASTPDKRSHAGAAATDPSRDSADSAPPVDAVILIASGLSAEYDLSAMIRQVRGGVYHLSSTADNLILGAGTMLFGTLDRKHGLAAGKTGFFLPPGLDSAAYARFVEVPYDRAWVELGHNGDHEGMMSREFGRLVVADLVRAALGVEVKLPTTRPASPAPVEAEEEGVADGVGASE